MIKHLLSDLFNGCMMAIQASYVYNTVKQVFSHILFQYKVRHTSKHSNTQLYKTRLIIPFKLLEKFQQCLVFSCFKAAIVTFRLCLVFEFDRIQKGICHTPLSSRLLLFRFSLAPHSLYYKTSSRVGRYPAGSHGPSCIHQALDCIADDLLHQWEVLDHEPVQCGTGPLKITQGLLSAHVLYISIVWNWKTQQVILREKFCIEYKMYNKLQNTGGPFFFIKSLKLHQQLLLIF